MILPLVSVVIPCFNASETVEKTIKSIYSQDYKYFEIVVVDDGSTDDTWQLLLALAAKHDNLFVLQQENQGPSAARNLGVAKANGDFIAFLDADDIFYTNSITDRVNAIITNDEPDLLGAFCPAEMLDMNLKPILNHLVFNYHLPNNRLYFNSMSECPFGTPVIVKKQAFLDAGGFDVEFSSCEDWDLWQRMLRQGKYFLFVGTCKIGYVQHPNSSVHKVYKHFVNWKAVSQRLFSKYEGNSIKELADGYGQAMQYQSLSNRAFYNAVTAAAMGDTETAKIIAADISPFFLSQIPAATLSSGVKYLISRSLCKSIDNWYETWNTIGKNLSEFLNQIHKSFPSGNSVILELLQLLMDTKSSEKTTTEKQTYIEITSPTEIDEPSMNVVLNFHKGDQHSAAHLLKLIMAVDEGMKGNYYLQFGDKPEDLLIYATINEFSSKKNAFLSCDLPTIKIPEELIENDPNAVKYNGIHTLRTREQKFKILGWNLCVFKYINELDHFLIIEPDCVVLKHNWLLDIYNAWQSQQVPIFGHLKRGKINGAFYPTHWAGCSVYDSTQLRALDLERYFYERYDNPWWQHRELPNTVTAGNCFWGPAFSGYDISYDYFLFGLYWRNVTGSNDPLQWPLAELKSREDIIYCDFQSKKHLLEVFTSYINKLPLLHGVKNDEIREFMISYFTSTQKGGIPCGYSNDPSLITQVESLQEENRVLAFKVSELLDSMSWKITTPLRSIYSLLLNK